MADQIEEIKAKVDIVELISSYVPLKRAGRNFKGLCPFHGEKSPSFMVNSELQIWKCFGCQKGGDAYTFLQNIEGMEFGEALKHLADQVGIKLTTYKPTQGEELKDRLIGINSLTADIYHYLLTKHKWGVVAKIYLESRKISTEAIEKFKIGFAPDSWDFLVNFLTGKKKMQLQDLVKAGLVVPGKNYDRFRNRIVFPLNNLRGQTVGFSGRVLPGSSEKEGGKYVNTSETEIYHKSELLYGLDVTRSEIKDKNLAVVVEGEIDAIASWQSGVKNVVAIKGSALTLKQVELLRRLCDTVVLALDADFAGDVAARRGIEIAEKGGLLIKVVKPHEKYKDPGEWAIADGYSWARAVAEAIPVYDFYLQSAVKRFGLDVAGKKRIGQELLPLWASIEDEIVKGHYIKELAKVLGVDESDIRIQLGKAPATITRGNRNVSVQTAEVDNVDQDKKESRLVEMALKGNKVAELTELPFKTSFWLKVVQHLTQGMLVDQLPAEVKSQVQELFLREGEFDEANWTKDRNNFEEADVSERLSNNPSDEEANQLRIRKAQLTKGR